MLERAGRISRLAVGGALLVGLLAPPSWIGASALPLLVGLLLGLPHGAVDHLVPAWLSLRARSLRARGLLLLAYAGAALGGLGVFLLAPLPALFGFLVLSVVHFGAADEAFNAERAGRTVRIRPLGVLAFGGPAVILPLTRWPDQVDPLLEAVAPGAAALLSSDVRLASLAALGLAALLTILTDLRLRRGREAAELALLLGLFAVTPPLLAVGVYFGAWHSLRHIGRLLRADPANHADLRARRMGPPLRRFAAAAALPSLGALGLLGLVLGLAPDGGAELLPAAVAVLAALTVPHTLVVRWVDRRPATP